MKPCAEFVATGHELLNGTTLNRHSQWLGNELRSIGWTLSREATVPDDFNAIGDAITAAFTRVDVVIVSGGLGPTSDDLCRDVAASLCRRAVIMHEPSRERIRALYAARGKPLNDMVENHALVVEGAHVLDNREGLAPGEYLEIRGKHLFLLPGPPREFHAVAHDHVLPWLKSKGCAQTLRQQTFQIIGLGESDIAARLNKTRFPGLKVETAYCANPSHIFIRLREDPQSPSDFDHAIDIIRSEFPGDLFCESEKAVPQVIVDLLGRSRKTLAVAESCTGGMLGSMITSVAGSSAVFRGGIVAYHNELKEKMLHVSSEALKSHGAVSEPVARAMADGARMAAHADVGVGITGIAGPDGGTKEKPVGLVYVCASMPDQCLVRELHLPGDRAAIREAACMIAMDLVRRLVGS